MIVALTYYAIGLFLVLGMWLGVWLSLKADECPNPWNGWWWTSILYWSGWVALVIAGGTNGLR